MAVHTHNHVRAYFQDFPPHLIWPKTKLKNWKKGTRVMHTKINYASRNSPLWYFQNIYFVFQFLRDLFCNPIHEIFEDRQVIVSCLKHIKSQCLNLIKEHPSIYWHLFIPIKCFNFKELTPSREKSTLPENSRPKLTKSILLKGLKKKFWVFLPRGLFC